MIERIKFWYYSEFQMYTKTIWLLLTTNMTSREIAEQCCTQIKMKPEDRRRLNKALHDGDIAKFRKILNEIHIDYHLDEDSYKEFLHKLMLYEIGYVIFFLFLFWLVLVLIYERRGF